MGKVKRKTAGHAITRQASRCEDRAKTQASTRRRGGRHGHRLARPFDEAEGRGGRGGENETKREKGKKREWGKGREGERERERARERRMLKGRKVVDMF